MTLKERFHSLTPFSQILFMVLIGAVSFFVINVLIAVVFQTLYSNVNFENFDTLIQEHPSLYMLMGFLPFQMGFLLIPGVLYFFYLRDSKNDAPTFRLKDWTWSLLLFLAVFLLLPFFSELNHIITKAIGAYDYLYELKMETDGVLFELLYDSNTSTFWVAIFLIAVMAGVAEELVFRGFLFNHLLKTTGKIWLSILASGFLFALLHFNYYQLVPLVVFGIALALIYFITKSLIPGMLLHTANNALNVFWISENAFPKWMDQVYLELTIPSTLLLMGLLFIKRYQLNLSK